MYNIGPKIVISDTKGLISCDFVEYREKNAKRKIRNAEQHRQNEANRPLWEKALMHKAAEPVFYLTLIFGLIVTSLALEGNDISDKNCICAFTPEKELITLDEQRKVHIPEFKIT